MEGLMILLRIGCMVICGWIIFKGYKSIQWYKEMAASGLCNNSKKGLFDESDYSNKFMAGNVWHDTFPNGSDDRWG